jgi:hypothetical protein
VGKEVEKTEYYACSGVKGVADFLLIGFGFLLEYALLVVLFLVDVNVPLSLFIFGMLRSYSAGCTFSV